MSVTSGFFNSLNGDRTYSAEQFSALFDNLITDGVFANVGTAFEVKANGENNITVGIGRAWFNSIWLYNDALLPMVAQDPEVLLNRIDAIVIEVNHNEAVRQASIRWVYGSPSSSPVRPTLTNTDAVHQYPLAYVYRKAGDSTVIQADITNMIGTSACPYVTGILATQDIDKVVAQWESQFYTWFDGLEASLSGDVAANLANQVLDLQSRFQTLAREKAVYEELQDSTGATIQDSNGNDILARTVLGGETVIINYPVGGGDQSEIESFKVGDTLTTMRTDLGEKWALCNGAIINRDEYTELSSVVPPSPNGTWVDNSATVPKTGLYSLNYNVATPEAIYDGSNYYVVTAYNNVLYLLRSSDLETWTYVGSRTGRDNIYCVRMVYQNGICAILVRDGTANPYVLFTSNLSTSFGSWSKSELTGVAPQANPVFRYLNDRFVILMPLRDGELSIYHSQNLTNWTQVSLPGSGHTPLDIGYLNGYYIVFSQSYSETKYEYTVSSDISSFPAFTSWRNGGESDWIRVETIDNKLYMVFLDTVTDYRLVYFACVTDLSSFPNSAVIKSLNFDQDQRPSNTSRAILRKIDSAYMCFWDKTRSPSSDSQYALVSFGDEFEPSYQLLSTVLDRPRTASLGIFKHGSYYKISFTGMKYKDDNDVQHFLTNKLDISKITLPSISESDFTHTYIKVKE